MKKKQKTLAIGSASKNSAPGNGRHRPYVVCIGASAGGLNAVCELVSQLPGKANVSVFIVLHLSKAAIAEILIERIKKFTTMLCEVAKDGASIKIGSIYVAPANAHLLVKADKIIIGHGPEENRFRPSIDVLFRSAAVSFGERTIGIVLTGFLNDGTAGMWAIRQSGGHCIVQNPNEAEYPDMPLSVLETMEVDYCISLKQMGQVITDIARQASTKKIQPPAEVVVESRLSEKAATDIREVQSIGEKTIFACPSCGGGLWSVGDKRLKHYRCHIGHSFNERDLISKQSETIEHTLWVATRMMEERKLMLLKNAKENSGRGLKQVSDIYSRQAKELESHIGKLKGLLFAINHE